MGNITPPILVGVPTKEVNNLFDGISRNAPYLMIKSPLLIITSPMQVIPEDDQKAIEASDIKVTATAYAGKNIYNPRTELTEAVLICKLQPKDPDGADVSLLTKYLANTEAVPYIVIGHDPSRTRSARQYTNSVMDYFVNNGITMEFLLTVANKGESVYDQFNIEVAQQVRLGF